MELRAMKDWPEGFYSRSEFDEFYLVVLSALPKTPDTLFLRLLGRGITFRDAIRELSEQSEDWWALALLEPVLVAFRIEIAQDSLEEEDMDALSEIDAIYAKWKQQTKDEGREEGRGAGLIEGIETLCTSFGIELSDQRRAQLANWDIPRLKRVLAEIGASRRWPDEPAPS